MEEIKKCAKAYASAGVQGYLHQGIKMTKVDVEADPI